MQTFRKMANPGRAEFTYSVKRTSPGTVGIPTNIRKFAELKNLISATYSSRRIVRDLPCGPAEWGAATKIQVSRERSNNYKCSEVRQDSAASEFLDNFKMKAFRNRGHFYKYSECGRNSAAMGPIANF